MKLLNILSADICTQLLEITTTNIDKFNISEGVRRRVGVNGVNKLSKYNVWKKWSWGRDIRLLVESIIPTELSSKHNEMWFLNIPSDGFIDKVKADEPIFKCLIVPLTDNGSIIVNGETIQNQAGKGVWFVMNEYYEIPENNIDQTYLAFIFLVDVSDNYL
jgi:hypothetical protein